MVGWKEQNLLMADRPMKDFWLRARHGRPVRRRGALAAEKPAERWIFGLREAVAACGLRERVTVAGFANRRQWWMFRPTR